MRRGLGDGYVLRCGDGNGKAYRTGARNGSARRNGLGTGHAVCQGAGEADGSAFSDSGKDPNSTLNPRSLVASDPSGPTTLILSV